MIISSLPKFLYLNMIGVRVVVVISFLQECDTVCHFFFDIHSEKVFQKGMKNDFLPVPLWAYGANTKFSGR